MALDDVLFASAVAMAAAGSLVLGAVVGLVHAPSRRVLGMVLAVGAGALFSAITFELVDGAVDSGDTWRLAAGMLLGAIVYVGGARLLVGGRADGGGDDAEGDARSIVLGATLDGIPESLAIGATVAAAGAGSLPLTLPIAVALSNFPEALAATTGLRAAGHRPSRILLLWLGLVLASGVAAAAGFAVLERVDESVRAILDAFTAGAVLAMLADTMIPDAYRDAGRIAGICTVLGFIASVLLA
ncbi:MAG: putative integral rane protein [Thermoleophilia bacterium]|nr:putative integral rane protein [Thermoleophilia bacterium]